MRVAVFSTKAYDREFLAAAAEGRGLDLDFLEPRLTARTAALAAGHEAVSAFVNDVVDAEVLAALAAGGTRFIALRSAGFNHVDLAAAKRHGIAVVRVPAYSPHAVAEFTLGLILALNRKIHRAYARVRDGNFRIDGLLGFDLAGKTVGVVGTGKIGAIVARLLAAFGCEVLLHDVHEDPDLAGVGRYVPVEEIYAASAIVTLHCPLTEATYHLIGPAAVAAMREGVMLVNTSRGGLIDTKAVIEGLKSGRIGSVALDVYEEESALFFEDRSGAVIQDDQFSRLLTFPNVLITSHQAFFTREALTAIAGVTIDNLLACRDGADPLPHRVE